MAKTVMLPSGETIVDRRQHLILTGPIITLIIFLFSQAVGGIWWASWVTTKLEFMTNELSDLKQSIKEVHYGSSTMVTQGSVR